MTTTNPDQLRREIEETQRGLSSDVNALTEKVTPSRIVRRRVGRARRAISDMKKAIMGTASDTTSAASDRMGTLAAGLIVFGLGWLTASLLPPSKREQEIADHAKSMAQEHVVPVAGDLADQLKNNLQQPAEQAVESIKSTARDAGSTVAEETRSATGGSIRPAGPKVSVSGARPTGEPRAGASG